MPCSRCKERGLDSNHPIYQCPNKPAIERTIIHRKIPEVSNLSKLMPPDACVYMVTLDEGAGFTLANMESNDFGLATEGLSGCVALAAKIPGGVFLSHIYSKYRNKKDLQILQLQKNLKAINDLVETEKPIEWKRFQHDSKYKLILIRSDTLDTMGDQLGELLVSAGARIYTGLAAKIAFSPEGHLVSYEKAILSERYTDNVRESGYGKAI